ncbi:hypothetical protein [Roseibium sp.]|uniref:hypothetical protein n=1 Tax=Roseibium sp. TaxID=1936156 RepID=UPI003B522E8F
MTAADTGMRISSRQECADIASILLNGCQLDTIRIHSLVIQLGFICVGRSAPLPIEAWLSLSGDFAVTGSNFSLPYSSKNDFFQRRALMLGKSYMLIGEKVTSADILETGTLQINLGSASIFAGVSEEANFENIWELTSGTPNTNANQSWYVSLADDGSFSSQKPGDA